jgi:thioester reductase-like protein
MAIFLTGATGYIGSYLAAALLGREHESLNLLVRAASAEEAEQRLWQALQLHLDFPAFREHLGSRIRIFRGDLTTPQFGLDAGEYRALAAATDSVLHCAASLNRKSERSCLNVNLRGTLEVVQLARQAHAAHGLRRFSQVSTVAVAGHRSNETVLEDQSIDWQRRDYDPYARTKKFCEHMVRELLPDVSRLVFRPSVVLGDSRRAETTQFDMVRAFAFLAGLPVLPLRPDDRIDIVPVDYVADAIVTLHQKARPEYEIYHLSSGQASETYRRLTAALAEARGAMPPLFWPGLERPFTWVVDRLSRRRDGLGYGASLLKVFLPYLVWNTVFDNTRVVAEMGRAPAPFSSYCFPLLRFSRQNRFRYPYRAWPHSAPGASAPVPPGLPIRAGHSTPGDVAGAAGAGGTAP